MKRREYMDKEYFSRKNTGGAVNYMGTAFQDCVSLIYLFDYIDNEDYKEITFEQINDFTVIFKDYEVSVQVKSNYFDFKSVNELLEELEIKEKKNMYLYALSMISNSDHLL